MALRIVAYTSEIIDGKVALSDSELNTITSNNSADLLGFLSESYSDSKREIPYYELKVAFDLDVFVAPILKSLGISVCKKLASPSHTYEFDGGSIFYIPSKIFSLDYNGHRSFIYHLAQYFENTPDPQEPLEIHALASILIETLRDMGMNPRKLTSPVAIYKDCILKHMSIPTIVDLPGSKEEELIDWAEHCKGRLFIESYQIGVWE